MMLQYFFIWLWPKKTKKLILTIKSRKFIEKSKNNYLPTNWKTMQYTFEMVNDKFYIATESFDTIFFGRAKSKDKNIFNIPSLTDQTISRIHGIIELKDGTLYYEQKGRGNTNINDNFITQDHIVQIPNNSTIKLGGMTIGKKWEHAAEINITF